MAGVLKTRPSRLKPASKGSGQPCPTAEYRVLIDLPCSLPVTEAELDLLEREVLPFIRDILRATC